MRAARRNLVLGAIAVAAGGVTGVLRAQATPRVIAVVARKFVFLPRDITLKVGEPVVFEFTSPEVVMGFYSPDLNLRALIVPGTPVKLPFTATKKGKFPFLCDVFCGDGHEGMSGEIVVT